MKRSKTINLERMRKLSKGPALKPLAVAIATATLVACSSQRDAMAYKDVEQCIRDNPSLESQCRAAYQEALGKSAKSGPKYRTQSDCESEFGGNNCVPYDGSNGQHWFMPMMAGFMLSRMLDRNGYYSAPLYTSYSRYSPAYNRWTTVDGELFGSRRYGSMRVDGDAFKSKPAVTRTISRGGFGSTVVAKSSWGGRSSSFRGGWGG